MESKPSETANSFPSAVTGTKTVVARLIIVSILVVCLAGYLMSIYWSIEPAPVNVQKEKAWINTADGKQLITGYTLVSTLADLIEILLDKPGGFLGNDILPPSVFMDDMPAFEYGALIQSRDLTRILRKEFSRSQSQSVEHEDLKKAEPYMHIAHGSWALPSAEGEYKKAVKALRSYIKKLADPNQHNTRFYARADNLSEWLGEVSNRLGSYSQRLSASVGQERINTDFAGDSRATQANVSVANLYVKTPWLEIDDVFFEARGACWALAQFLRAVAIDFDQVLAKKNAKASLQQIIRELDSTQDAIWSPIILNGDGFGFVANHSLVMASYISRANAGLIDLRDLLTRG